MNKYELMYIIDVALEDEARKEIIDRVSKLVTDNGGEVEKTDEWGKRRLAYTIDYKNEGYYVLVNFTANPDLPKEIERVLQINENVLRYLIIKLEEKHTSVKPRQTPLRPQYGRPFEHDAQAPEAAPAAPAAETVEAAPAPEAIAETVQVEASADAPAAGEAEENLEATVEAEA